MNVIMKQLLVAIVLFFVGQTASAQFGANVNLDNLNGINGFSIIGAERDDFSGYSVSSAGDFNGDGIDDLIIGAPSADGGNNSFAGKNHVIFGNHAGFPHPMNLTDLDGSNGIIKITHSKWWAATINGRMSSAIKVG